MKVNIIHLPDRKDRWALLQNELCEQNITDYKVWNGIIDPFLTFRGIAQAHKQIVKHAKEENLSEVLIAEDDLHFTSQGAFQFFLNRKPENYDIYLGGIYYGTLKENNMVNDFSGLTFYIVNEKFYDKFLSTPEQKHLDIELRDQGKFIVCNPFTVIQHNGFSDNRKQYCNYDNCLKNRKLFGWL